VDEIEDEAIRAMQPVGSIDLISDNTDVLESVDSLDSWPAKGPV
jgi:hypothetical protein